MQVSVVIPTFRRPELLARCLAAISRQRLPAKQFEVIVADDAADDATRRQVESLACGEFRPLYLPVVGHHGPAAARNTGWRDARGEIIAFTDDDCIPDSGWLAAGIEPFIDPAVIAVTGQTIVPLPPCPTDYERNVAGLEQSEFLTANCFCRRDVLLALGGFDERFTTAWREDSDLHFRLLDLGGNVRRVTSAVVVHPVRKGAFGISLCEQRKSLFDALLFRKHPRHFRERIRPTCPSHYYAILAAALIAIIAAARGHWFICLTATAIWLGLSIAFCLRRLRGTSHAPAHLAEMAVTSLLIPFLSIFWRLVGAVRYRVAFW
jgi:glycosyltransferase involved in cell wall biosynthesis